MKLYFMLGAFCWRNVIATGFQKLNIDKFRDIGIRVVYKIERTDSNMKIIVVSARTDEQVYNETQRHRTKYNL